MYCVPLLLSQLQQRMEELCALEAVQEGPLRLLEKEFRVLIEWTHGVRAVVPLHPASSPLLFLWSPSPRVLFFALVFECLSFLSDSDRC